MLLEHSWEDALLRGEMNSRSNHLKSLWLNWLPLRAPEEADQKCPWWEGHPFLWQQSWSRWPLENWIRPTLQGEEMAEVGGSMILDGSGTSQDLFLQAPPMVGADKRSWCSTRPPVGGAREKEDDTAWAQCAVRGAVRGKNHYKERIPSTWGSFERSDQERDKGKKMTTFLSQTASQKR